MKGILLFLLKKSLEKDVKWDFRTIFANFNTIWQVAHKKHSQKKTQLNLNFQKPILYYTFPQMLRSRNSTAEK